MFILRIIRLTDMSAQDKFILICGYIMAILIAIMSHELAHGIVAKWNGDDTAKTYGRLTINPIKHFDVFGFILILLIGFGWAKPVPVNPNNFKKRKLGLFTVSIAGVLTNFLLACISISLMFALKAGNVTMPENAFLQVLLKLLVYLFLFSGLINISLAIFNLLPFYPLDGYNVLSSIFKEDNKVLVFLRKYGFYILLILLFGGSILGQFNKYLDPIGLLLTTLTDKLFNLFSKLITGA